MQTVVSAALGERMPGTAALSEMLRRRRGTGDWEFVAISMKSPYTDTRALLVPNQAEMREYRAMFWDNGQPNGEWCDVARITVSP